MPARRYSKASDGVDEHRYLHATPFGENLVGPGSSPELHTMYQRRRRLVAEVLVNSIQLQADGHTGYTCSSNLFEKLFGEGDFASPRPNDPFECWRNDNIEQALHPLTPQKISNGFGDVQGQLAPAKEEVETMLLELLEKGNATIRTTVTTDGGDRRRQVIRQLVWSCNVF